MKMKWLLLGALALCAPVGAQGLTTVQDSLYAADGRYCAGAVNLSWPMFMAPDGRTVYAGNWDYPIAAAANGLSVTLEPGQYTATYNITPTGCAPAAEQWVVPASATPVNLASVRGAPSSSTSTLVFVDNSVPAGTLNGANTVFTLPSTPNPALSLNLYLNGMLMEAGSDYTLAAATVTFINGVVPGAGDALLASYRTGSSGVASVDNSVPTGTLNGTNAVFTLASAPSPALSLELYRNGLRLAAGGDFTLSGSTVTFGAGAIPQPGDALLASYRTGGI
jgi:hypothetical protein